MPTPTYHWPTVTLDDTPNAPAQSTLQMAAMDDTLHDFETTMNGQPMWASGTVSLAGGSSVFVTFPSAFPATPRIMVTVQSTTSVVTGATISDAAANGFRLHLDRDNTTTTPCQWIAVYTKGS